MAKGKLAVGLDIGSTSVKMIVLKEVRRRGEYGFALQNFGMKPLPPEAIVDGALMNSTASGSPKPINFTRRRIRPSRESSISSGFLLAPHSATKSRTRASHFAPNVLVRRPG